jgi:hypothetical protein
MLQYSIAAMIAISALSTPSYAQERVGDWGVLKGGNGCALINGRSETGLTILGVNRASDLGFISVMDDRFASIREGQYYEVTVTFRSSTGEIAWSLPNITATGLRKEGLNGEASAVGFAIYVGGDELYEAISASSNIAIERQGKSVLRLGYRDGPALAAFLRSCREEQGAAR